ncbi:hypothetical protein SDC9_166996 [bioreactor metagenome]|uniref:Uncharacterized protein n=1 Tax=bioreactor metagenome TaxID=1076179 RepID=A0A645G665_9ZZZZ
MKRADMRADSIPTICGSGSFLAAAELSEFGGSRMQESPDEHHHAHLSHAALALPPASAPSHTFGTACGLEHRGSAGTARHALHGAAVARADGASRALAGRRH